jgi:ATP-binding cassette subfamily F protein 3
MAVLVASKLRKEIAGNVLFDGVSFKAARKDRIALSGPNGAGKTTLLRALAGQLPFEGGELMLEKGTRVALHDQRPPRDQGLPLFDYVLSGAQELLAAEHDLLRLEAAMANGQYDPETLNAYAEAQVAHELAGGYTWREYAESVLRGLGFADEDFQRDLASFSGGELTRASLARALAAKPDLLLLDEPTNHLDVATLEWLEQEINSIDAAVILVAHDRWFLEAVTNAVLEIGGGRSTYFPGPWHKWRIEKAARLQKAEAFAARATTDIQRLERFHARFAAKSSKAAQAQSKLKQVKKLEKLKESAAQETERLNARRKTLGFEFIDPPRSARTVLEVDSLDVTVPGRTLVESGSFHIERGEHIAIVGPNGSGKTTLLETLLGNRDSDSGASSFGENVIPAYFSQHEDEFDDEKTALEAVLAGTELHRNEAQALLGRFLFSGDDAHKKKVGVLSGGERRRLALAILVASGANLLVLDEPTNHLDLESREALETALEAFPGSVILVSHDRALLDAVAERTVAIEEGELNSYDGGWADYVRQAPDAKTRKRSRAGATV